MPRAHPLASFMASLEDEKPLSFPLREAQRDTLVSLFTETERSVRCFKRGEFIRYIGASGPLKKEAVEGLVLMFWRYLDLSDSGDQQRIRHLAPEELQQLALTDCLIACFDGECVRFDVSASVLLTLET